MAVNSKHVCKFVCGLTLCARADARRPGKLSALPLGDQIRSEATVTDTTHYDQTNIWVIDICMCWLYRGEVYFIVQLKSKQTVSSIR